jgi:hypothetical protein
MSDDNSKNAPKPQRRAYPSVVGFYALYLPMLTHTAREHGYALGVHGSMATDLDLVAIPWTEEASDTETLVRALTELMCGLIPDSEHPGWNRSMVARDGHAKPHGRVAYSIYFHEKCVGPYIDLSVMPLLKTECFQTSS